ncbi:Glycosyltransferase [hydrothermal vent metagenome]|uniref:Glycosyltransferase n=1 Tax=hydrothermal vent metagenome TaxID=652676 RepID=A0A3B0WGJ8_9ZZZZ
MKAHKPISVYVVTHKTYQFPNLDMYLPLHVGCKGKLDLGYIGDDTGDNISNKNAEFCELTGLYWVWKNAAESSDYVGFSHYRRYFQGREYEFKGKKILTESEILKTFEFCDIILPVKRKYVIENVYDHYKNAHHEDDILKTRKVIASLHPEYLAAFDTVMRGKSLYLCNMFVMKQALFKEYMSWFFSILNELEGIIDTSTYDSFQGRVFGFLGERLFNVWVEQSTLSKKEIKVVNLEGERYLKKTLGVIRRKFKV